MTTHLPDQPARRGEANDNATHGPHLPPSGARDLVISNPELIPKCPPKGATP